MPQRSTVLSSLGGNERAELERRLLSRQSGKCFICDKPIDLVLHQGNVDIDHIVPLADHGPDEENNFAITHASCNRSKSASDLRVARRMAEFEHIQAKAREAGERGANLGHLLDRYGGARSALRLKRQDGHVEFVLSEVGSEEIRSLPLYKDHLSGMEYFFALFPLAYLHHDDRINPRSIGANIRALIEEFMKGRPQLHVSLAWWAPDAEGLGQVKVFDGQHKAAAQILLGTKALPVRVFVEPDPNVLLQTNTNAGSVLRQVAFDTAVLRHLGSSLYAERVDLYKENKGLGDDFYSFSEQDLVTFFRGEHREVLRYVIDSARDAISFNKDNRLMQYVELAGRSSDRPLGYMTIERTFFKEFLYKKALTTPIDEGIDQGTNPRVLEREQMVRLMNVFADRYLVGKWDPEIGGRRLERRVQKGDPIAELHLRAWRLTRDEVTDNVLRWVRLVIENYYAWTTQMTDKERLLHQTLPDALWKRIESFLDSLGRLPCWVDKNLSLTVFGAKQNREFWDQVFRTGKSPGGVQVLAKGIDLQEMIQNPDTRS